MATTDLSAYDPSKVPDGSPFRFTIVVSDWNSDVTMALHNGAVSTLLKHGVAEENITTIHVPGSFELVAAARMAVEFQNSDAIICLGCVIQGETPHFDYVCNGVTAGLASLNTLYPTPFIFGLLTTLNQQQALDRAGGKHGNKGDEAAITAIRMASLRNEIREG